MLSTGEEGETCHPLESKAWFNFDATHPELVVERRNVTLDLCTDSFNPFKTREGSIHHV